VSIMQSLRNAAATARRWCRNRARPLEDSTLPAAFFRPGEPVLAWPAASHRGQPCNYAKRDRNVTDCRDDALIDKRPRSFFSTTFHRRIS
jgi:hypothetical protein